MNTAGSRSSRIRSIWMSILFLLIAGQVYSQNLLSVSPDSAMQGQQVTITVLGTQTHFTTINNRYFIALVQGNMRIIPDSFDAQNDSLLYAYFTLPYTTSGWCDMNVLNFTDGNMIMTNAFYIIPSPTAPKLVSINPDSAYQGASVVTNITSVNTNYASGNITRIRLERGFQNRFIADSFTVHNDTNITAFFTFPFNAAAGLYDLRIDHSNDGTLYLNDGFEVVESPFKPILKYIEPDSAYQGTQATTLIVASNTNFTTATFNSVRIQLGFNNNIAADSFSVINDTALNAYFTISINAAAGNYNVVVDNSMDGFMVLVGGFEVILSPFRPQIISIVPDSALQGESVAVTVTAINTHFQSGVNTYIRLQRGFGNIVNADSASVINDTLLMAYFSISYQTQPNTYDFRINNSVDGLINLPRIFLIKQSLTAPQLLAVYPDEGEQNQYVKVIVNGSHTHFLSGTTTQVLLQMGFNNMIYADSFDVVNDSLLYAHFNIALAAQTGVYNFRVVNNIDGTLQLNQAFTINATQIFPKILSVSPDKIRQNLSYVLSVTCQYTSLNTPTPPIIRLIFDVNYHITMDSVHVVNDTFVNVYITIPDTAPVGLYDVEIIPYGAPLITAQDLIEVLISPWAPQLGIIDPDKAHQGDSLLVSIHGKNTHFTGGAGLSVRLVQTFRIISPQSIQIVNDSLIEAIFVFAPNVRLGFYDVEVNGTVDGNLSLTSGFEILVSPNAPQIEYIMPARAMVGEILSIWIKGKNTQFSGSNNPRFRLQNNQGMIMADSVGVLNDTILIAFMTIPKTATAGLYNVILWGITGGNMILPEGFEIFTRPIVNEIISVTPDSAYQGDTVMISIICRGTEFTEAMLLEVFLSNPLELTLSSTSIVVVDDTTLIVEFIFAKNAWEGLWDLNVITDLTGKITGMELFKLMKSTVGISGPQPVKNIKVYPNPSSDYVIAEFESVGKTSVIVLHDLKGQLLFRKKMEHSGIQKEQINLEQFANGPYLIQIWSDKKAYSSWIIKK